MIRRRALVKLAVDAAEWQTMGVVPPGADRLTLHIKAEGNRALTVSLPERRLRRAMGLIRLIGPGQADVYLIGSPRAGVLRDAHVRVERKLPAGLAAASPPEAAERPCDAAPPDAAASPLTSPRIAATES
jgi:hypothetical protein